MYVVPTPFRLVEGVAHQQTLILPAEIEPGDREKAKLNEVGKLSRRETDELIIGYSFDLQTNDLVPKKVANPGAGREHMFRAWRVKGSSKGRASMAHLDRNSLTVDPSDDIEGE